MIKQKKSGPAVFMYCVIAITLILSVVCFTLHYGKISENRIILWTGIVSFMIMYHLWLRIIMGNVSKLFNISYTQSWFKEMPFEKKLYSFLKVKKWKDKALTYNPELFSLKDYSLEDVANTMAKAETDHWINEIISLVSILFSLIWGKTWIFVLTAILAMAFDGQFIIIQRYNRPRIVRIISNRKKSSHPKESKRISANSNYGKGLVFKMISNEGKKLRFKYTGHTRYSPNKSSVCGYGSDEWFYLCNNKDGDYMLNFSDSAQGGPIWVCYQLFPEESNKLKSSELSQWLEIVFDYYKKKNRKQITGLHLKNIGEVKQILPRYSRMQTFEDEHYYGI